ncbi:hypothetical protein M997_0669 [Proteus hauseri ATCC 700826]|uniref:Uncharacterized protein n=1 Tax=Proteus hauseri ATCC 700826 TaxID=1354271 RepID=A0AAJ3HUE3_PROHU|nr:hypothetical protein M997_0669 [Proteus hauseri ATCC 700826]
MFIIGEDGNFFANRNIFVGHILSIRVVPGKKCRSVSISNRFEW